VDGEDGEDDEDEENQGGGGGGRRGREEALRAECRRICCPGSKGTT